MEVLSTHPEVYVLHNVSF